MTKPATYEAASVTIGGQKLDFKMSYSPEPESAPELKPWSYNVPIETPPNTIDLLSYLVNEHRAFCRAPFRRWRAYGWRIRV